MKNFREWPPNYKFGYVCACVAFVVCAGALIFVSMDAISTFFAAMVLVNSLPLVVMMPRWAQV